MKHVGEYSMCFKIIARVLRVSARAATGVAHTQSLFFSLLPLSIIIIIIIIISPPYLPNSWRPAPFNPLFQVVLSLAAVSAFLRVLIPSCVLWLYRRFFATSLLVVPRYVCLRRCLIVVNPLKAYDKRPFFPR